MAVRIAKKPPVDPAPPEYVNALLACIGRDPAFMREQRVADAGPFATMLPGGMRWSQLEDMLRPDGDGVAA